MRNLGTGLSVKTCFIFIFFILVLTLKVTLKNLNKFNSNRLHFFFYLVKVLVTGRVLIQPKYLFC